MSWLCPQRWTEDTQQVEISQVIHLPFLIQTVDCGCALDRRRDDRVSAENQHIQTTRRRIIDPLGRESPNGIQRGKINLLSVDELVPGVFAHVVNVFNQEGVLGGLLCEEDDLGAAEGEFVDDGCSYTRRTALLLHSFDQYTAFHFVSTVLPWQLGHTVIITTLECINRSEPFLAPPK